MHLKNSHKLLYYCPAIIFFFHKQMFNRKKYLQTKNVPLSIFFCALHIFRATLDRHHLHLLLFETMCCDFAILRVGYYKQDGTIPKVQDPHFAQRKQKIGGWISFSPSAFCRVNCGNPRVESSFSRQKTPSNTTTTAVAIPRAHGRN